MSHLRPCACVLSCSRAALRKVSHATSRTLPPWRYRTRYVGSGRSEAPSVWIPSTQITYGCRLLLPATEPTRPRILLRQDFPKQVLLQLQHALVLVGPRESFDKGQFANSKALSRRHSQLYLL
jgi:hypothetical protein